MTPFRSVALVSGLAVLFGFAGLYIAPNMEQYAGGKKYGPFKPEVTDADTISDGDLKFRLVGVDACELGQPISFEDYEEPLDCGYFARAFVKRYIADNDVVCYDQGSRSYGRIVARCFLVIGRNPASIENDIGAFALFSGWAVSTNHARGMFAARYQFEETMAKIASRGAWRGTMQTPAEWRRTHGG